MDEVGLRDTVDPLAGSYFIETLTKEMETKIHEEMKQVQKMGGMVHAVASGFIQRKVAQQAYEFEKGLQNGDYTKVGVNKYTDAVGEQPDVDLHEYDESWVDRQIENLKQLRRSRDNREVTRTLTALEHATKAGKNVMPYLVECCQAYATVGEMAGVFRLRLAGDLAGSRLEPAVVASGVSIFKHQ